jgi:hypothetical protein
MAGKAGRASDPGRPGRVLGSSSRGRADNQPFTKKFVSSFFLYASGLYLRVKFPRIPVIPQIGETSTQDTKGFFK